jgi:choline-phosphate cytidylyltransferase
MQAQNATTPTVVPTVISTAAPRSKGEGKTVVCFGTFDLLHVGHVKILQRAATFGTRLFVGVSSDAFTQEKKRRKPVYSEKDRLQIVAAIKGVTGVFLEESMEKKREYLIRFGADVLIMGDDWATKFDHLSVVTEVVYLSRTPFISTTGTIIKAKTK